MMPSSVPTYRFPVVLLALAACGHTTPTQRPAVTPEPAAAEPTPNDTAVAPNEVIEDFMGEHYAITAWARDVVIGGEIEELREPLRQFAEYRYDSVEPGGWVRWIAELQATAGLTARAESMEAAAMGVAAMARVCGECHVAAGSGPQIYPASPMHEQPTPDTLTERMFRHIWASDQLWEGLTTPNDQAWQAGAEALAHAPATTSHQVPAGFRSTLQQVRELGVQARDVSGLEQRAEIYGQLLATCANCHAYEVEDPAFCSTRRAPRRVTTRAAARFDASEPRAASLAQRAVRRAPIRCPINDVSG